MLCPFIRKTKNLVHLDLSSNQISSNGAIELFNSMCVNESVYCFIFKSAAGPTRNVVKPSAFKSFEMMLKTQKILGIIDISGNLAGNSGLQCIANGLIGNLSIISLCLSQIFVNESCIDSLLKILKSVKLRYLDISNNKLNNTLLEKIAEHFNNYTCFFNTLNFSYCGFSGLACAKFFNSQERSSLKALNFDGNCLVVDDLEFLGVSVSKLGTLRNLSLNSCQLSTDVIRVLCKNLLEKSFLSTLHLQSNRINVFFLKF